MITTKIILLSLSGLAFIGMVVVLVRARRREVMNENGSLAEMLSPQIYFTAGRLIHVVRQSVVASSLFVLLLIHRLVAGSKKLLHRLEHLFSGLIEAVRGQGQRKMVESRRGGVSFFLEQIKVDQTTSRR